MVLFGRHVEVVQIAADEECAWIVDVNHLLDVNVARAVLSEGSAESGLYLVARRIYLLEGKVKGREQINGVQKLIPGRIHYLTDEMVTGCGGPAGTPQPAREVVAC